MAKLNLGKVIPSPAIEVNQDFNDFNVKFLRDQSSYFVLGNEIEKVTYIEKILSEELTNYIDNIFMIDTSGFLSSVGLISTSMEPDDFAQWITLIDKDDVIDLKAIEISSKFKENAEIFNIFPQQKKFEKFTKIILFTPNSDVGITIAIQPIDLIFKQNKTLAKPLIKLLSSMVMNKEVVDEDKELDFCKDIFGFINKKQVTLDDLDLAVKFIDQLAKNLDKFKQPQRVKENFLKTLREYILKNAVPFYEGIGFSDIDKIINLFPKKNRILSFYISEIKDTRLEKFVILKLINIIINSSIAHPDKNFLLVIDNINEIGDDDTKIKVINQAKEQKNMFLIAGNPSPALSDGEILKTADITICSKLNNKNVINLINERFSVETDVISRLSDNNFVLFEGSSNDKNLFAGRQIYSYHKSMELYDIRRFTDNEVRNLLRPIIKRIDKYEELYPEIRKAQGVLLIMTGPYTGKELKLAEKDMIIGRYDIFPDNRLLSRKHLKIEQRVNDYFLIDLSVNGTFVKGERIKEYQLENGDMIYLGSNEIMLQFVIK